LLVTWICGDVLQGGVAGIGWGNLIGFLVLPGWFMTLFLITPAITMLSFLLGIIGSVRAKEACSAQNSALFIIFPVFALIAVQVTGFIWFTPLLTLALFAILVVIDWLVLRLAVKLFQREAIIIKWQ
jgi:hypothetical protein